MKMKRTLFAVVLLLFLPVYLRSTSVVNHRGSGRTGRESSPGFHRHSENLNVNDDDGEADGLNITRIVTSTRNGVRNYQSSLTFSDEFQPSLNCSPCSDRELKRSYRIESIKSDILRKLRLSSPPNATGRRVPDLPHLRMIIDQLNRQANNSSPEATSIPSRSSTDPVGADFADDDRSTTIKVIQLSRPYISTNGSPSDTNVVYFVFSSNELRHPNQVVTANFGIYIRPVRDQDASRHTWILVYEARNRSIIRRKKINYSEIGQWYHFDVKTQVQLWIGSPESNYGLRVLCTDAQGEPLAVTTPLNEIEESYRSYLEIETRDLTAYRSKRTADLNCDEHSSEKRCCRYPLVVDFEAFGWDWVIVPKRYSAFYCSGECPFLFYQKYPHAHIFQQTNPDGSGGPCCSPKKVSSMSMLYYDENMNIVYGRLPGMVVDKCGCA